MCIYVLRTIEMPAQYANGDQQSDDHESFNFLAFVAVTADVVVARLALLLLLLRVHCGICFVFNFILFYFSFLFFSFIFCLQVLFTDLLLSCYPNEPASTVRKIHWENSLRSVSTTITLSRWIWLKRDYETDFHIQTYFALSPLALPFSLSLSLAWYPALAAFLMHVCVCLCLSLGSFHLSVLCFVFISFTFGFCFCALVFFFCWIYNYYYYFFFQQKVIY